MGDMLNKILENLEFTLLAVYLQKTLIKLSTICPMPIVSLISDCVWKVQKKGKSQSVTLANLL